MNKKLKLFIAGVVLFGGGILLGKMIGAAEVYKETSGEITDQLFRGASSNLNLHLALAELLHANETEKVAEKLETLIDLELMTLAGYAQVPARQRRPEILKHIEKARAYRQKHPTSSGAEVSAAIMKTYDLVN